MTLDIIIKVVAACAAIVSSYITIHLIPKDDPLLSNLSHLLSHDIFKAVMAFGAAYSTSGDTRASIYACVVTSVSWYVYNNSLIDDTDTSEENDEA